MELAAVTHGLTEILSGAAMALGSLAVPACCLWLLFRAITCNQPEDDANG